MPVSKVSKRAKILIKDHFAFKAFHSDD